MKKKLSLLAFIGFMLFALSSCTNRITLLFLNWGEYIDESLLDEFEDLHNCNVSMDLGESNEIFYSKVFAGTTVYDVVCPSDYMVMKMYKKGLLEEINFEQGDDPDNTKYISSYNPDTDIREGVKSIRDDMISGTDEDIVKYYVPYLWGTWGLMYSTKKDGLENAVINNPDGPWAYLFRKNVPNGTRIAMYDSHQHAYYSACRYLGKDVDKELPQSELDEIRKLVEKTKFNAWGTDNIKKNIVADNLDLGFMWTGDFLYYYAEQAADRACRALIDDKISNDELVPFLDAILDNDADDTTVSRTYKDLNQYEIGFDIYIPTDTIAFCDNLVIVKDKSRSNRKTQLIYDFINFMSSQKIDLRNEEAKEEDPDGENASDDDFIYPTDANTQFVCYDTPFIKTYHGILELRDDETIYDEDLLSDLKMNGSTSDASSYNDSDIYWAAYNYALSIAFEKYYPENGKVGSILGSFDRKYVNLINNTFNNARA